jgi:hypothetical protein
MTGAALLAARAGLKLGAGRVFAGLLHALAVDPLQPELMLRSPDDALAQATTVVVGPGLGVSDTALAILRRVASADFPLVLDADALNLLAARPVLAAHVPAARHQRSSRRIRPRPRACSRPASRQSRPTVSAPRWNWRSASRPTSHSRAAAPSSPIPTAAGASTPPAIPGWPRAAAAMCSPAWPARCWRRAGRPLPRYAAPSMAARRSRRLAGRRRRRPDRHGRRRTDSRRTQPAQSTDRHACLTGRKVGWPCC